MEFYEKLQELRKQKGLTQEELARVLYVSRTAISKWESGRGYPNIDSLKRIAGFFGVTVDGLLSGQELLTIAEEDTRKKEKHTRDLVFGLLDCGAVLLFFLPLLGQKGAEAVQAVSLIALTGIPGYLKAAYFAAVAGMLLVGVVTLALQNCRRAFWAGIGRKVSLAWNMAAVLLFIISAQPYAAVLLFLFLTIKVLMLLKWE